MTQEIDIEQWIGRPMIKTKGIWKLVSKFLEGLYVERKIILSVLRIFQILLLHIPNIPIKQVQDLDFIITIAEEDSPCG